MSEPGPHDTTPPDGPKLLLVAGAGRSGTSTLAGIVRLLGVHVPQPEVAADESNPRGFAEPAWVIDFHDRLLERANVQVSDARPDAWRDSGRVAAEAGATTTVAEWLRGHLELADELVVKDPRLGWFLGTWLEAARLAGGTPVVATMLRPPAEVVGSRQRYYAGTLGPDHLAAAWANMLLHTEHATRGGADTVGRVFVRYADLLADWEPTTRAVGERLGLRSIREAGPERVRAVEEFVDPSLRRVSADLADLGLPPPLHELVAETWNHLDRLAEPGGDVPVVREALDQLRQGYAELYEQSAAMTRSSVVAAEQAVRRSLRHEGGQPARPAWADRVPHRLRAAVPEPIRTRLRRIVPRR